MSLILLPLFRFVAAMVAVSFARAQKPLAIVIHLIDATLLARLAWALARGTLVRIVLGNAPDGIGVSLVGDPVGLTFAALAWGLSVAVFLYAWKDRLRPYFYLLVHLLIGACYALAFTQDLFNAYLLFELLTLVSFLLVGYQRLPRQILASLRYLVLSSVGMSLFLLGIGVVYAHCGRLDWTYLKPLLNSTQEPWMVLAGSLLVAGIAVKAGVFTFSLWLPSAHARAMPVVSALLSGLVIKMGVLELFRLADVFPIGLALIVLGSITGLLGIVYAIKEPDIKRMLAFHTLSQIGYALIGFGAGSDLARRGALAYVVAHGLFKALLFLTVGEAAACAGGSKLKCLVDHRLDIPNGTRVAMFLATLGIVGLPPLAGYDAKAVLEDGLSSLVLRLVVILISVGTVASFAKLVPLWQGRSAIRVPLSRAWAYAWLAGAILLFWPLSLSLAPLGAALHALGVLHLAEAAGVLAVGGGLFAWLRNRRIRLPETVFRLEVSPLIILGGFFMVYALLLLGQ
jgi:multicomponent Na+:H+ antiporter subunit D